ncbi:MAG: pilus assembly protein [Planctomycetaceae bacterium]
MKKHFAAGRHRSQVASKRSGAAAAEFAVCLPLLMILLIGTIEACSMIYLKQTLSVAAYEGIRAAVTTSGDTAKVNTAADRILTARNVSGAVVTISPVNFESMPPETWITVTVSAPGSSNSVVRGWFYDNQQIAARATMMKEF